MILCTVIVSLTAPLFARIFAGETLALTPQALGLKLFAMLAGAVLVAAVIRKVAGREWIARQKERIDGVNIIVLFIFVAALMGDIVPQLFANPLTVAALTLIAFTLTAIQLILTFLVFAPAGRDRAFAIGLMASQRNMGLMLAAVAGTVPDLTWLYFALGQFPIYLLPQIVKPIAERLVKSA
jgi:BASS family bile acid:Na+ symporter